MFAAGKIVRVIRVFVLMHVVMMVVIWVMVKVGDLLKHLESFEMS